MARTLVRATPKFFSRSSAVVTGTPFTVSCWVNHADKATSQEIFSITNSGTTNEAFRLSSDFTAGGNLKAASRSGGNQFHSIISDVTITAGVWASVIGIYTSSTLRQIFVNGDAGDISTDSITPSGLDQTGIGVFVNSSINPLEGSVAETAVWNAALTVDEVATIVAGFCPLFVRPTSLVAYWPLTGRGGAASNEEDWVGAFPLTQTNSPAVADHPRIIYPARRRFLIPVAVLAEKVPYDPWPQRAPVLAQ